MTAVKAVLQIRTGSYDEFHDANMVYRIGEQTYITSGRHSGRGKVGDGITPWRDLKFAPPAADNSGGLGVVAGSHLYLHGHINSDGTFIINDLEDKLDEIDRKDIQQDERLDEHDADLSKINTTIAGMSGQIIRIGHIDLFTNELEAMSDEDRYAALESRAIELRKKIQDGYTLEDKGLEIEPGRYCYWQYQPDGTWFNLGERGDVSRATQDTEGIVKGSTAKFDVDVRPDGTMRVNELPETIDEIDKNIAKHDNTLTDIEAGIRDFKTAQDAVNVKIAERLEQADENIENNKTAISETNSSLEKGIQAITENMEHEAQERKNADEATLDSAKEYTDDKIKDLNISGGAGSTNALNAEITLAPDGIKKTFALPEDFNYTAIRLIIINGVVQLRGAYQINAVDTTITFEAAPLAADGIEIIYNSKSGESTEPPTTEPPFSATAKILGDLIEGETLITRIRDNDNNDDDYYFFQFLRGDAPNALIPIEGITQSQYKLTAADAEKYIGLRVTKRGYSGVVNAPAVGPVLGTTKPDIPVEVISLDTQTGADGSTTGITAKFEPDINDLTSADYLIDFTGTGGSTSGEPANNTDGTWTIPIEDITSEGEITIEFRKDGYDFIGGTGGKFTPSSPVTPPAPPPEPEPMVEPEPPEPPPEPEPLTHPVVPEPLTPQPVVPEPEPLNGSEA